MSKAPKHFRQITKIFVDELDIASKFNRELDFFDSSFTIRKQRVIDICEEINRQKWTLCGWRELALTVSPMTYSKQWDQRMFENILRIKVATENSTHVEESTFWTCTTMYSRTKAIDSYLWLFHGWQSLWRWSHHPPNYSSCSSTWLGLRTVLQSNPHAGDRMYTLLLQELGRDYWREHIENGIDEDVTAVVVWQMKKYNGGQDWPIFDFISASQIPITFPNPFSRRVIRSVLTAWQMLVNQPGKGEAGRDVVG